MSMSREERRGDETRKILCRRLKECNQGSNGSIRFNSFEPKSPKTSQEFSTHVDDDDDDEESRRMNESKEGNTEPTMRRRNEEEEGEEDRRRS